MGKRSDYERRPRDFYPTPIEAVQPLISHLPSKDFNFIEPCAGDGRLIAHLESLSKGKCISGWDIEPQGEGIVQMDALETSEQHYTDCDLIITNPPWSRDKKSGYIFHKLISHFACHRPTWLLADADWIHTLQSAELVEQYLCKIVSIGRVKWFGNQSGKDNCCWYLFDATKEHPYKCQFYGRVKR